MHIVNTLVKQLSYSCLIHIVYQFFCMVLIILVYLSNKYMNLTCVGIMTIEKYLVSRLLNL